MIQKAELLQLPKILDDRGNLSFFEGKNHVPFDIKRTYLITDVPGGQTRGGHAYVEQIEFIVCLSGSFDVVVNDGETEERHHLNRSYYGLLVPNMLWRYMENFSTNAVALVCSSTLYNEGDYIRNFDELKNAKGI